jgi:hypothetical protein
VQLADFVFVAVSAARRLFEGSFPLDTLRGAGNVGLLLVAVAGALVVATTQNRSVHCSRPTTGRRHRRGTVTGK